MAARPEDVVDRQLDAYNRRDLDAIQRAPRKEETLGQKERLFRESEGRRQDCKHDQRRCRNPVRIEFRHLICSRPVNVCAWVFQSA